MKVEDIKKVCVIGAGNMGHQISLHCALMGYETSCTDINEKMLKKADAFVDQYLPGRVKKQKMTEDQAAQVRRRIRFVAKLEDAVKDADLVIEAAVEYLDIKRKIFADIDKIAPPHAILSTNSSTIVSSKIASGTHRPDKVINMHFFNPALVMKLVEVVQGPHVSQETTDICLEFCKKIKKVPVHVKKEVRGFLLNRIGAAIHKEARWILDMGVASVEDIDNACVYGFGHPMGPFRLNDLTGIDLAYIMAMEKFKETGNPEDYPPPCVVEHFSRGEYGRKTGKGWYNDYDK